MKKIIFISLFILAFYSNGLAQNNSLCPKVEFTSPISPIHPGDEITFSLNSNQTTNLKLEYKWQVSLGTIIAGQGTSSIKVTTLGLEGVAIKATVEIKGLPENCPNSFSENGIVAPQLRSPLYDEYKQKDISEEKLRIDITMTILENVPETTAIFYLNFKNPTQSRINSRLVQIQRHFIHRGYSLDRVIFVITKSKDYYNRIYVRKIKENEKFECRECNILKIIKGADINFKKPQKK